jgi:hypothetical protein
LLVFAEADNRGASRWSGRSLLPTASVIMSRFGPTTGYASSRCFPHFQHEVNWPSIVSPQSVHSH